METSLSERIVRFLWHSLNTDFQRVCKILVCVCGVHGDIYVWIMHFMWPSSIVWRQSFADICWAFLAGWLQKAPHSEIPQSFQRDTLQQTELQNIQLRSLALLFYSFLTRTLSPLLFLPLITLSISLSVCFFSHFSVISLSAILCTVGNCLLIVCNFSYCLRVIRKPFSHSQNIKNKQMRQKKKKKHTLCNFRNT